MNRTSFPKLVFQSTPSAWRVTFATWADDWLRLFQSTPSAWRVTLGLCLGLFCVLAISIHTLRMEGDSLRDHGIVQDFDFNPHPPHGG